MTDMHSLIDDLLASTPEGKQEMVRAKLRVDVTEQLQLRMQALGVNKAALAASLGVSRSAVSQALAGSRNMSLNTLADMAHALHLQVRVAFEDLRQVSAAAASNVRTSPVVVTSVSTTSWHGQVVQPVVTSGASTARVAPGSYHSCVPC